MIEIVEISTQKIYKSHYSYRFKQKKRPLASQDICCKTQGQVLYYPSAKNGFHLASQTISKQGKPASVPKHVTEANVLTIKTNLTRH